MADENQELPDSSEQDEQVDETTEEVEETTEVETTDDESNDSENDEKIKQLLVRTQKAETKAKEAKAELAELKGKPDTTSISREEVVLIAKGMDDEDLDVLKTIQKGSDISLKEAEESSLFKAHQKDKKSKVKKDKAQLPSSKKSLGKGKDGKPLTDAEHQDKFNELTKDL